MHSMMCLHLPESERLVLVDSLNDVLVESLTLVDVDPLNDVLALVESPPRLPMRESLNDVLALAESGKTRTC